MEQSRLSAFGLMRLYEVLTLMKDTEKHTCDKGVQNIQYTTHKHNLTNLSEACAVLSASHPGCDVVLQFVRCQL